MIHLEDELEKIRQNLQNHAGKLTGGHDLASGR